MSGGTPLTNTFHEKLCQCYVRTGDARKCYLDLGGTDTKEFALNLIETPFIKMRIAEIERLRSLGTFK